MVSGCEAIIGFAIRARKVIFGTDKIETSKKKCLIICDKELSENALKKMVKSANDGKIDVLLYNKSLEELVHKSGVKAIAIIDYQMAKAIARDTEHFTAIKPKEIE